MGGYVVRPSRLSGSSRVSRSLAWPADNGVTYDDDLLSIVGDVPGVMCIRAKQSVASGAILAAIPKEACITRCTTQISGILHDEGFSGGLGLVIAVWYEKGIGSRSKWAGYFASMNEREYLPVFWSAAELVSLQGTEVSDVASDVQDIVDDYEDHVVPLMRKYGEVFQSVSEGGRGLAAFKNAASLVASRAFAVDAEHGDGMVPLADLFNHKVSVVQLNEEWGINGADDDDDDGDDDGDGDDNDNDDDRAKGLVEEKGRVNGDHDSSPPSPSKKKPRTAAYPAVQEDCPELCGMTLANGLDLRLQIAIIDDDEAESLQIVAASDVERGNEVFNCYGELSNDVLLKKYGFCVPENPFSYVTLDKRLVVEYLWDCNVGKSVDRKHPMRFLYDRIADQTSLLDEGDEPFMIHSNGHVNVALFAFLRMVIDGASVAEIEHESELERDILDNPRIVEAMTEGMPVVVDDALRSSGGSCGDGQRWAEKCREALRRACMARSKALVRDGKDKLSCGGPEVAQCLRSSEEKLIRCLETRLK